MSLAAGRRSDRSRPIVRATILSTVLIGLGSLLGLGRDLIIASYFGADGSTDAFLVAWTVPETAVPLLVDGAMMLLLVPAFVRALEKDDPAGATFLPSDPHRAVAAVVTTVLPRLFAVLAVAAAVTAIAAPELVGLLAPGLADPALGAQSMRIVSVSLLFLGLAGFMVGALRAHMRFGAPAAVALVFNIGIVGTILVLHEKLGVLAAALGITVGAALVVTVQLPSYLRRIPIPQRVVLRTPLISFAAFVPIVLYTVSRQAQTFVERYFGSSLPPGTISHLNFAQKIGQLPASLALILAVVTFPILARSLASGQATAARTRTEADIRLIGSVVMVAAAFLYVFAPYVVDLLFGRGAFTPDDVIQTSAILRVYVFGLLGQVLVEVVCRTVFSQRTTYRPVVLMGVGLVVTAVGSAVVAPVWGAPGIAFANALGISVTAALLLLSSSRRDPAVSLSGIGLIVGRLVLAAAVTGAAITPLAAALNGFPTVAVVVVGGATAVSVFAGAALLTGVFPIPRRKARP